jgi:hypothetical protein
LATANTRFAGKQRHIESLLETTRLFAKNLRTTLTPAHPQPGFIQHHISHRIQKEKRPARSATLHTGLWCLSRLGSICSHCGRMSLSSVGQRRDDRPVRFSPCSASSVASFEDFCFAVFYLVQINQGYFVDFVQSCPLPSVLGKRDLARPS